MVVMLGHADTFEAKFGVFINKIVRKTYWSVDIRLIEEVHDS